MEHLAARQLVPALGRDDARQHRGQRIRSRAHRTAGRTEIRRQPRAGDVRHPRRRRGRQFTLHPHRVAERRRLAGAARTGRVGHRRGTLMVPDAERTGLRLGIQRRAYPARVRSGTQHGHPRRAGRTDGARARGDHVHPGDRRLVVTGHQPSADALQTHLHEGLGSPQGRRAGLRPR